MKKVSKLVSNKKSCMKKTLCFRSKLVQYMANTTIDRGVKESVPTECYYASNFLAGFQREDVLYHRATQNLKP